MLTFIYNSVEYVGAGGQEGQYPPKFTEVTCPLLTLEDYIIIKPLSKTAKAVI